MADIEYLDEQFRSIRGGLEQVINSNTKRANSQERFSRWALGVTLLLTGFAFVVGTPLIASVVLGIGGLTVIARPILTDTAVAPSARKIASNLRKVRLLFAMIMVIAVLTLGLTVVYDQPWSKIKVIIHNQDQYESIKVALFIDGNLKALTSVAAGGVETVGVWSVDAGNHTVSVDWGYSQVDGHLDWAYDYAVGPLYTKNVVIYV